MPATLKFGVPYRQRLIVWLTLPVYAVSITAPLSLVLSGCGQGRAAWGGEPVQQAAESVTVLPAPVDRGLTLVRALEARRSVRDFFTRPLSEAEISQLLWAAQGVTHGDGYRTTPSAGALYPLELYVATSAGLFHYIPGGHRLARLGKTDLRTAMQNAAFGQPAIGSAAAVFVVAAVYRRTAAKYGAERGARYVHIEVGHAAQNLLLEAAALGLGAVPVGAFDDPALARALNLPTEQEPLYLMAVGEPLR